MNAPRYRVLRMIGRGGMAEVLEAIAVGENGFERRVALKRLLADCAKDEEFLQSFADEARIASQLHHAGIVAVFDYGLIDGLPFIASELVEGFDLAELEERIKAIGVELPIELALFIATEIAHALAYAHAAKDAHGRAMGIVHRDVSPENILLSHQGDVKLADFGIALAQRRLAATRIGIAKGKPSYMAPEQVEMRDVDARADLYSLGVVLSRIAPQADAEVQAIIAQATRPNRRERFATGAEMAAACGRAMMRRLADDARTSMRAFLEQLVEPKTVAALAKRPGADLLDVMLVLDGPVKRFASSVRAEMPVIAPEPVVVSAAPAAEEEPDTELTRAEVLRAEEEEVREHLIGQSIGSYRIEALLGSGMSARVYRARHEVFERPYALKVLHAKHRRRERLAVRLRREAKALSQIEHENVVRVFDCGTTPSGLPYLVSELCEGRSLSRIIREEAPFEEARAASIARQIAAGLAAAHAQGFVHRDLKPGNIMIVDDRGEERVKIVDFGLSRVFGASLTEETQLTRASDLLGTPAYMAPEQAADPTRAGPAADLFALGMILGEMLTGMRPPAAQLGGSALGAIAERLLVVDVASRLQDGAEVAAAIDALSLSRTAIREPQALAPRPPISRNTWRALFAATVLAGVGAGVWLSGPRAERTTEIEAVLPVQPVLSAQPAERAEPKISVVPREVPAEDREGAREPAEPAREREEAAAEAERDAAAEGQRPAIAPAKRAAIRAKTDSDPAVAAPLVDAELLRAELAAAKRAIEARAARMTPAELDLAESRWFQLRDQITSDVDPARAQILLKNIRELAR